MLMSFLDNELTLTKSGRPSHLIDPNLKNKEWILRMVKSIYSDYNKYCPNLFYNDSRRLNENVKYFLGLIDPNVFDDKFDQNKSETKNLSSLNRDKRILQVASKYIRILKGRLDALELDIVLTPSNQLARNHEDEYMSRIRNAMKAKAIFSSKNMVNAISMLQELGFTDLPETDDELQMQRYMSKPWMMATYIEMFLNYCNSYDDLQRKLNEANLDVVTMGAYATKVSTNREGIPVAERIDPRTLLVGYSNTEDFRDISEVGQFRTIDINTLIEEDINRELSPEDLKDIEQHFINNQNDPYFNNMGLVDDFDTKRTLVLDIYFYSWDEEVRVLKKNSKGNPRIYRKSFDYYLNNEESFKKNNPDKELYRIKNQNVYKATWVVGTDYLYNCGIYRDTERVQGDPYKTKFPIAIYAPLLRDGYIHSIMDEIKPLVDSANLKWQRIQEAIAKALPPGQIVDIDGLLGAVQSLNDKDYTWQAALEMATKENVHIVSGSAVKYGGNGAKYVEQVFGGLGPDFSGWLDGLRSDLMLIQDITGFSSVAAGSPDKYMGKGVSDAVMNTADFSIKHLYLAKKYHFQDICKIKKVLGMDLIASGKAIGIKRALGNDAYDYISIHSDASQYEYDLIIEPKASEQQWADIYSAAKNALSMPPEQGGITLADYLFITECTTLKQAKSYLYITIKKNIRKGEMEKMKAIELKAEQDKQTAEYSAQVRVKEQEAITKMKAQQSQIELQSELTKMQKQFEYDMELKKFEALVENDYLTTKGAMEKEVTQIKAAANMDRVRQKE
jgi:hypothetical protein